MNISHTPSDFIIDRIRQESSAFQTLPAHVGKVIIGQHDAIQMILIALLCNGHILLEGVPGTAKTTMIKAIARCLGLVFNRIQFTPDLLPADIIGTLIYNPKTQEFETKKGPIFAQFILADEINRAPAKVQAALLEAMQEQQVTIGTHTYLLEKPFLVFATQNPIEQEGTYRLPEAQIDRFMFKIIVHYPSMEQEREMLCRSTDIAQLLPLFDQHAILQAQELVSQIYVDSKIVDYIVTIIAATRSPENYRLSAIKPYIVYGASPRATLALLHAAQAYAFLKKRHFVTPDDIKFIAPGILRHRIVLSYEAQVENVSTDVIVHKILATIPTP